MSIAGAVGAALRPPAFDADDLRLLAAGIDPRQALVDLKFTRNLYRIGRGRPYVADFAAAGGTVTGGAGFATAVDLSGNVVGPFPANTLPVSNNGVEVWEARTNQLPASGGRNGGWATRRTTYDRGCSPR